MEAQRRRLSVSESQKKYVMAFLVPKYLSLGDNLILRLGVGKEKIGSNKENSFENQGFILVLKHYFLSAPKFTFRFFSMKFKNKKLARLRELSHESKMRLKMSFRGLSELLIVDEDTAEICQFLQLFESITSLHICNAHYQGYRIGLQHIQHLQYLNRLHFSYGEINAITVKYLGNLKSLIELEICSCTFLEESEQNLKELTGLKELRMYSNKYISFKDRDDSYLCHLTGLKVLELGSITSVEYLRSFRNLDNLTLGSDLDHLTMGISFVDLGTLDNLSSLNLNFPEYMNLQGISQFCPNLENLDLYSESERNINFCHTIKPLVGLLKLKKLNIMDYKCDKINQIGDICKITSLTSLDLSFENPLSYEFCNSLKCLTRLEILSLWLIEQNNGHKKNLDCLKKLPRSIHTLELNCTFYIISEVLYYLSEQTNITCLNLEDELENIDDYLENDASRKKEFFMSLDRYIVTNRNLESITGYVNKAEMSRKREELLEKEVEPFTILLIKIPR